MQQRLPSLIDPPIGFAHRGARAHAPENTLEAFTLALRLGATGLESDVWVTRDGVAVLDHDGVVRQGLRRRPIAEVDRDELPASIPSLAELLAAVETPVPLSLDVCDVNAYGPTMDDLRDAGPDWVSATWLCDPHLENLVERRDELGDVNLVHSTRLSRLKLTPELHASKLAAAGIDAMNMHHTDWSGGLVVMFHRFEVHAFAWDLQFEHQLEPAIRMGMDGVYSDRCDLMMDVMSREVGRP